MPVVRLGSFDANIGGLVGGPTEVAPPAERGCSIQQIQEVKSAEAKSKEVKSIEVKSTEAKFKEVKSSGRL